MPRFVPVEELFKGRHFDQEIVVLCVRWYLTFKLSYRDLVAMMAERGIDLAHTTILRWVQALHAGIRAAMEAVCAWVYLYRAVDKQGFTVDFYRQMTPTAFPHSLGEKACVAQTPAPRAAGTC